MTEIKNVKKFERFQRRWGTNSNSSHHLRCTLRQIDNVRTIIQEINQQFLDDKTLRFVISLSLFSRCSYLFHRLFSQREKLSLFERSSTTVFLQFLAALLFYRKRRSITSRTSCTYVATTDGRTDGGQRRLQFYITARRETPASFYSRFGSVTFYSRTSAQNLIFALSRASGSLAAGSRCCAS